MNKPPFGPLRLRSGLTLSEVQNTVSNPAGKQLSFLQVQILESREFVNSSGEENCAISHSLCPLLNLAFFHGVLSTEIL